VDLNIIATVGSIAAFISMFLPFIEVGFIFTASVSYYGIVSSLFNMLKFSSSFGGRPDTEVILAIVIILLPGIFTLLGFIATLRRRSAKAFSLLAILTVLLYSIVINSFEFSSVLSFFTSLKIGALLFMLGHIVVIFSKNRAIGE